MMHHFIVTLCTYADDDHPVPPLDEVVRQKVQQVYGECQSKIP